MQTPQSIRLKDLTINKRGRTLLKNVSCEFHTGSVIAILGSTGCGKSTLIRALAGLDKPAAGRIYFDETDVTNLPPYERKGIATVLQRPGVFPGMTPRMNLELVLDAHFQVDEKDTVVEQILEYVELKDKIDERIDNFSGGEMARVALARAMAVEPSFLIIDEALTTIDVPMRRRILGNLISDYRDRNRGLIFVTHDQLDAFMFADLVLLIEEGMLYAASSPQQLYIMPSNKTVGQFFGLTNTLEATVKDVIASTEHIKAEVLISDLGIRVVVRLSVEDSLNENQRVYLIIRPENLVIAPLGIEIDQNEFMARIARKIFAGPMSYLVLQPEAGGTNLIALESKDYKDRLNHGDHVSVRIDGEVSAVCD